ncbi:hypothetical protein JCM10212_005563 [Sporobolomyces blumeae]
MPPDEAPEYTHWLIKAEPDSRIEKGVDVKFSIDDFEKCKVSSWEGVRNHQAKNFLKSKMKLGHQCLFYASNCKQPGVTGIAEVVKEGYPDHNAWDPNHPYYDPKSKEQDPTWYMVDVEFVSRLPHLVPLSLLQHLATVSSVPSPVSYLGKNHLDAIRTSALVSRGRLSVQPASDDFFEACKLLGEKGGFDDLVEELKKGKVRTKGKATASKTEDPDQGQEKKEEKKPNSRRESAQGAREAFGRAKGEETEEKPPRRRSARTKRGGQAEEGSEDEQKGAKARKRPKSSA